MEAEKCGPTCGPTLAGEPDTGKLRFKPNFNVEDAGVCVTTGVFLFLGLMAGIPYFRI